MQRSKETRIFTRKITKTLLHPEDSNFRISDSQKQEGITKKKGLEEKLILEYLHLLGIKPFFLVYVVIHVIILDIRL
jgi:hypothetical protein